MQSGRQLPKKGVYATQKKTVKTQHFVVLGIAIRRLLGD